MPQKKVLVVDDDKLMCWALEKEFLGLGLSAQVVENGADALVELRRHPFDIVFLDIHLPDANGIELLPEIDKISPRAKIVIMSGDASEANRQRAYIDGAVQFLEKPFDLSEVHAILKSTLEDHSEKRKHPRQICRIPLRISIADPAPEEAQYDLNNLGGLMLEVGPEGFKIRIDYPLRVGQRIRARTVEENDPYGRLVPAELLAEVVWVDPSKDGIVAGLKFVNRTIPV